MSPDPEIVTPTLRLCVARIKQLLILSTLTIVFVGCNSPAGRDVRAYKACLVHHPHETALCEGPRQAYEVDAATLQARAAAIGPRTW